MSSRPARERDQYEDNDKSDGYDTLNGERVRVTRYRDGSSTYHYGGPCGDVQYDSNGDEC